MTNSFEIETDFRQTCLLYENELKDTLFSDSSLSQDYQEYINAYRQKSSLALIKEIKNRADLHIYDTETETLEVIIDIPEPLSTGTCITQLPNGDWFCFGNDMLSGIALIINRNNDIQLLPSGVPCMGSSAVYFDKSVYCFGGSNKGSLTLSERLDLENSQWLRLNPMPNPDSFCHSIVLNRNILISGSINSNLLEYSIDNDSFIVIPFEFAPKKRKILVDAGRLYLIECAGKIYESEIGDETSWKQIANSCISTNCPSQVYCKLNKGSIYLATNLKKRYYKFSLEQKIMVYL